jgi:hypothetical protein
MRRNLYIALRRGDGIKEVYDMYTNKKGVSEVVANVLIVLLVIVGVAVVWAVVKPTLDKSSQGVTKASDCFTVKLEPVSCTDAVPGNTNGDTAPFTVVVKRGTGTGTVEKANLIFEDSAGARYVLGAYSGSTPAFGTQITSLATELQTASFGGLTPTGLATGTKYFNVAPTVNGQVCEVLTQEITCV